MRKLFYILTAVVAAAIITACSNTKNTSQSRWWHSFTAKYNTYYNGSLAYIDGALEKENNNKDNFTEMIPLYTVGNKQSREIGKGNFDRAIEKSQKAIKRHSIKKRPEWTKNRKKTAKDIEWLSRKEYNPFLWKAWLMMGKSQFMKGAFDEAASTFAYMARMYSGQPAIYGKARAWLAKCYIQQDWLYDAEDVIKKMQRDSIDWRAQKEWNYTFADYYIHTKQWNDAIPYLKKVIKREARIKQKAREYYLLGQIYALLGNKDEAYKAFRSCSHCNPPYQLDFNARIAMTEVAAEKDAKGMISLLKRMARNDNNKEYLDQVYYAIGNIYLAQKDTTNAITAYEKGNKKATRSGIEKGVLLLKLGDIYWKQEKFSDAKRCYGEAIGLLDKDRDDYEQLSNRSKILDELVPYTDAIHLNDSLLALSVMPEKDRNAAIDRVIEALKKKEKEEKDRLAEENAAKVQQGANTGNANRQQNNRSNINQNNPREQNSTFYFYNPTAVSQGKQQFQKLWGKRENVDDWQRSNKTVVAQNTANPLDESMLTDEQRDSIATAAAQQDSIDNEKEKPENDPHKREYYMLQIPFEESQKEECHATIADGLYNSGVIFKDKLDNLPLSEKQFTRLMHDYPTFERNADVYYHSYLLYSRKHESYEASKYLDLLKENYPEHEWTKILSDPYFADNAINGVHQEDSLYAATYDAFKANRFAETYRNYEVSTNRYPLGANRDKFVFIHGLSKLNDGDTRTCLQDMETVVTKYPKSGVQPLAGMIINGVKEGRTLHGGRFDMGDIWSRRTSVMADSDSIAKREFIPDLNIPYTFLFAYNPDSLENENKLLFELARFNFTTFMVRNFEIQVENIDGVNRMKVNGFQSYQEARQYARQLYEQSELIPMLAAKARPIIISDTNLELLGTQYSYNDYEQFYETHYVPLKLSTLQLLNEPIIDVRNADDLDPEPDKPQQPIDDGEQSTDDGFNIPDDATTTEPSNELIIPEETPVVDKTEEDTSVQTTVEEKQETVEPVKTETETTVEPIKEDKKQSQQSSTTDNNVQQSSTTLENVQQSTTTVNTQSTTINTDDDEFIVVFDDDDTGNSSTEDTIILDDNNTTTKTNQTDVNNKNNKNQQDEPKKKDATELENEFFEIEDF
ncbi:MAG: hypothetical protein HUK05_04700 [Prevotella sp.]|nr:hypothetical protein [Prevotella sp.]